MESRITIQVINAELKKDVENKVVEEQEIIYGYKNDSIFAKPCSCRKKKNSAIKRKIMP